MNKFIRNRKGAALVYVIITAAIIILLAAATTAAAFVNLRATQIQERSNTNFYNADSIINTIVAGLESDMSTAYENAYTTVITSLDNEENTVEEFNTIFKQSLNFIKKDKNENLFYDVERLRNYVEQVRTNDVKYTVSAINDNCFVDSIEGGVILRNLHVTYEDDNGYFDEITTDIKISVPQFNINTIPKETPRLNKFVFSNGLEIENTRGLEILGNTYINTRYNDNSALILNNATSAKFTTPNEFIIGGNVITKENTEMNISSGSGKTNDNVLWAEDVRLGRYSTVNISGITNMFDDLEIHGSHSDVVLSGEYYGFGNEPSNHYRSSVINVNGANTKLDISKLDVLVLAGASYVRTSSLPTGDKAVEEQKDILQGESIAIKSNQIAYLVDDKEFSKHDLGSFVSNPMTYAQYNDFLSANSNASTQAQQLADVVNILSTKKLSYGKSYSEFGATIIPIFRAREEVGDPGTVYLYLQFNKKEDAARYFDTVYGDNTLMSQRLRAYAGQYVNTLKLNKDTSLVVGEHFLDRTVEEYTKDLLTKNPIGTFYEQQADSVSDSDSQKVTNEIALNLNSQYLGDGTEDGDGKKFEVMYKKIVVDKNKLQDFIDGAKSNESHQNTNNKITEVENGVCIQGTSSAKAYIINNEGKEPFKTPKGSGLIITSGEVHIENDWTGTIIANGHATVCSNGSKNVPIKLTIDDVAVSSVLPLYFVKEENGESKNISVINVLQGFEGYNIKAATQEAGVNADVISNCITFVNWIKH